MNNNLSSNVNFFLGLQNQFKILHWQTKGYARHKAFGEIYETLDGLIDEYVEICMGKHGRFALDNSTNTIQMNNLSGFSGELSQERDTDLLNLRDEMLGSLNKLAYLLTLE
jgi:DNA-binding ferritin-like protein